MNLVIDFHLHSKYSRAVSKDMVLEKMAKMAEIKGIDILACGDFTHPDWFDEIKNNLETEEKGIYKIKNGISKTRFILGTEIACIYSQKGKSRRVHILVFAPDILTVEEINRELRKRGCNLKSDGRPIIGLSLIELFKMLFSINKKIIVIPAHIWTPWYGLLGEKSGFESLRESCGIYAENIFAIETGLSSDPEMNYKINELKKLSIVSFSDAHSLAKLGREVTILSSNNKKKFNYEDFFWSLQKKGEWKVKSTVEFYPEEGKYHIDGHRNCKVSMMPKKSSKIGKICPVCGKKLTGGVLGRVNEIANNRQLATKKIENGIAIYSFENGVNYVKMVPLVEILAQILKKGVKTKTVELKYQEMIKKFGNEIKILLKTEIKKIYDWNKKIGKGIEKVRMGDILVNPGYDGVFGEVKIDETEASKKTTKQIEQMILF